METDKPNENVLFPAFFDSPYEFNGKQMRVVSAGVLAILQRVNSPFLRTHQTEEDAMKALLHYLYVCSAPIADIVKNSKDPETFDDAATEYAFDLQAGKINELATILSEKLAGINASSVTIETDGPAQKKT